MWELNENVPLRSYLKIACVSVCVPMKEKVAFTITVFLFISNLYVFIKESHLEPAVVT